MTANVETLKTKMSGGGARPNRFDVIINNPVDPTADDKLLFQCKAASLPVNELGSVDVWFKGRATKFLGDRAVFPNWTISIYCDQDFLIRRAFERWMSSMNSHVGNSMGGIVTPNPYSYKSDGLVIQQSTAGDTEFGIKNYRMVGMFPVRIGEITLDWETANQIEIFEVEFAYDYWTSDSTDTF